MIAPEPVNTLPFASVTNAWFLALAKPPIFNNSLVVALELNSMFTLPALPFLVNNWITPFAPCAPYKDAAAAPCTTSTLSMMFTSIEFKLVPRASIPSIKIIGEVPPCTELIPLNKICKGRPGLPLVLLI